MSSFFQRLFRQKKQFKIFLMGFSNVGKTSILNHLRNEISEPMITIGIDIEVINFEVADEEIHLSIFDLGGSVHFHGLYATTITRASSGGVLVFDLSNRESFEFIPKFLSIIRNAHGKIPLILLGNKSDLTRVITKKEAENFASKNELIYFETSAKTGENIKDAFTKLAENLIGKDLEISNKIEDVREEFESTKEFISTKSQGIEPQEILAKLKSLETKASDLVDIINNEREERTNLAKSIDDIFNLFGSEKWEFIADRARYLGKIEANEKIIDSNSKRIDNSLKIVGVIVTIMFALFSAVFTLIFTL